MDRSFVCPTCGHRQAIAGDCPRCPEEPLLDAGNPEVLDLLRDIDARRRDRVETWLRGGSVPLGIALAVALMVAFPPITGLLPLPRFMNGVLLMVAVGAGLYLGLTRLVRVRPRFPWLES